MKKSTKEVIEPLLRVLRSYPVLEEVRAAEFYLKGRDFIHFHETDDGVVADVLLSRGRVSMPVDSPGEQAELLEKVESRFKSLEEHDRQRHGNRNRVRRRGA
jgi:hypothetical protein